MGSSVRGWAAVVGAVLIGAVLIGAGDDEPSKFLG